MQNHRFAQVDWRSPNPFKANLPGQVCSCLSDHDFLLVLQTSLQAMMLRKHGPNQCICVDITQGDLTSGNSTKRKLKLSFSSQLICFSLKLDSLTTNIS